MKSCTKCKKQLPLSSFHRETRTPDGLHRWCRTCANAWRKDRYSALHPAQREKRNAIKKAWYRRNRNLHLRNTRNWELKRKYGIDSAQYETLLALQGRVCGLCGGSNPKCGGNSEFPLESLATDHDHITKIVRGLLCGLCNRHLGVYEKFVREFGEAKIEEWLSRNPLNQEIKDAVVGLGCEC